MIKHLSQSHEVVVASLARSEKEAQEGKGIAPFCHRYHMERVTSPMSMIRMVARLPTRTPSSMGYFYSPKLAKKIKMELETNSFDLIFVHCSSVAQYVEDVKGLKIIDFGDMDSQKWLDYTKFRRFPLSMGYFIEGTKLRKAEIELAKKFDLSMCTTPGETKILKNFNTGRSVDWIANGVNLDYFKPGTEPRDRDLISFVGRMDYYPNSQCIIDFCKTTFPLLKKKRPKINLVIVGANPPESVFRLQEIDGVTVTGSVPDVRPYIQKSSVSVAPLKIARGTQNKILEALAMGVPTVSSVNAAGGIDATPGEHFLTASSPEEYADAILEILEDDKKHRELSESGRARMLSNHNWENSMKKLDQLIDICTIKDGTQHNADDGAEWR